MQIQEAYLHVLDAVSDVKLLSERPMILDVDIEEYAQKHIEGFFEHLDIVKLDHHQVTRFTDPSADFKEITLQMADAFFEVMQKTEEIKPCDLMCLKFEREGRSYIGFLKLNFRTSFAHAVAVEDQLIINKIVRQVTTLPYKSQKVEEAILFDLSGGRVLVKDKMVTVDGGKSKYIAEHVLGVSGFTLTEKRKIDLVAKTAEKVIEKYEDQSMVKVAGVKHLITSHLDERGALDVNTFVKQCFDSAPVQEAYEKALEEKGLALEAIEINENQSKKLKRTQKIKTASGVEIILPFEYVSREENLEIINHPDGTVSIALKNLGALL